jgi:hypothetical protein
LSPDPSSTGEQESKSQFIPGFRPRLGGRGDKIVHTFLIENRIDTAWYNLKRLNLTATAFNY